MDDREKDRRFRAERRKQLRAGVRIQSETYAEILRVLKEAKQRILASLVDAPSEYESWRLGLLQTEVRRSMESFERGTVASILTGLDRSWNAGSDLVTKPLEAAGVDIRTDLVALDPRLLVAMRSFQTDKIRDISSTTANKVNTEIGQAAIGVQTPFEAAKKVADHLDAPAGRARTIVRTELGTVYSEAGQQRMEQAVKLGVAGLQKQWRRSGKLHPRITHEIADGQIVDVDKPFLVGGIKIPKPRDPSIPASERINCGCSSLPYMKHWRVKDPGARPYTAEEIATSPIARQVEEVRTAPPRQAVPSAAPPEPPEPPAAPPPPPPTSGPPPISGRWPWPAITRASPFDMSVSWPSRKFDFYSTEDEARRLAAQLTAGIPESIPLDVEWWGGETQLSFRAEGPGVLMVRNFKRRGERAEVDHSYFSLDSSHQGGGHAKRMLQASLHAYDGLGVGRVTVHADIDVGGYAWARSGFAMDTDMIDEYRDGLVEAALQFPANERELIMQVVKSSPDVSLMYDIARLGGGPPTIGKRLLVQSDWYGFADLVDERHRALLAEALSR